MRGWVCACVSESEIESYLEVQIFSLVFLSLIFYNNSLTIFFNVMLIISDVLLF